MDITPCNSLAPLLRKIAYLHKLFQTVEFTTDNGYLPIMNTNKEYLPPLKLCIKCGEMPQLETSRRMEEPTIVTAMLVNTATVHPSGLSANLLQFVCGTDMLRLDLYSAEK